MAAAVLLAILTECGCLVAGMPGDLLRMQTADYRTFTDAQGFVVAFFPLPEDDDGPLHVVAGNVAAGRWTHVTVPTREKEGSAYDRGPVRRVQRSRGLILIEQEVALDGVGVSILAPDLKRLGAIYAYIGENGYFTLPNGLIAYRIGQPHFAPTHWVELYVFDTRTGQQRLVYPTMPYDLVRVQAMARAKAEYAALNCLELNHHCNPEWFDSDTWFDTPPVANEQAQAFAFGMSYGLSGPRVEAIVACDGLRSLATIVCRETPHASWQRLYPTQNRQQILEHAAATPRRINAR